MSAVQPTPFAEKKEGILKGTFFLLLATVLVAVLVALLIVAFVAQGHRPKETLTIQDNKLIAKDGTQLGVAQKEKAGDVWRVFAAVKLDSPTFSRHYHGWFRNEFTGDVRYAGEFFQKGDGTYSLTYTTEEDVTNYGIFQVSSELSDYPKSPANNIAQWAFQVGS